MTQTLPPNGPLDVNEAFQTEQRGRIADQIANAAAAATRTERDLADFTAKVEAGNMRDLGNGRFQTVGGWDDGEVWTVRRNVAGQTLVLPEHGLATTADGRTALYSRVPMWHELGQVAPEGLSDIKLVLDFAGLNYTVIKEQATRTNRRTGLVEDVPGQFWTVREDTDEVKGQVGGKYEVIQNAEQCAFLQDLVNLTAGTDTPVVFETAGELANGRIFVTLRVGEDIIIDVDGYSDPIRPFLAGINSHDGSTSFTNMLTPWRIGCGNTERFAVRDAVSKWSTPHTKNARVQLEQARRTLNLTSAYYRRFAAEEQALARTALKVDEFARFAAEFNDEFWPLPRIEDGAEQSARAANGRARRIEALVTTFEAQTETLSRTAYAAERAVTEWLDWHAGVRVPKTMTESAARANKAVNGDHDTKKARAHEKLMLRVR